MSSLKTKLHFDDSLDVFAVHGVGGILGMLSVGIFASLAVNPAGATGLVGGSAAQLLKQLIAVGAVSSYTFAATWILGKLVDVTMGLRVGQMEESVGLDLSQHGERAYGGFLH
jgi:Amt family ammonium transporter